MTRMPGVWWYVIQIERTIASVQLQEVPMIDLTHLTCTQTKKEHSPAPGALCPCHRN